MRPCRGSMQDGVAYRIPCQPGGVIPAACDLAPASSHGAPAGTFYPAEQSSSREAAGGAEPLAAAAASLFGLSPDS